MVIANKKDEILAEILDRTKDEILHFAQDDKRCSDDKMT